MSSVSDIKLIRTDTTLDLSQKAEKRYRTLPRDGTHGLFTWRTCGTAAASLTSRTA